MVRVEILKEDSWMRVLRCREGNKVWYQMWIMEREKMFIERFFLPEVEIKFWWLRNLQRWYVFFYEKNGRNGLGKDRTKQVLRSIGVQY